MLIQLFKSYMSPVNVYRCSSYPPESCRWHVENVGANSRHRREKRDLGGRCEDNKINYSNTNPLFIVYIEIRCNTYATSWCLPTARLSQRVSRIFPRVDLDVDFERMRLDDPARSVAKRNDKTRKKLRGKVAEATAVSRVLIIITINLRNALTEEGSEGRMRY